jgi:hypothetical protein
MIIRYSSLILVSVIISLLIGNHVFTKSPTIITIDHNAIFKEALVEMAKNKENEDQKKLEKDVLRHQNAIKILNKKLAELAQKNNLIIIDKNFIIGAQDQTDQARKIFSKILKKSKENKGEE